MSKTIDIECSRCGRQFRVRAEFAGKSTRCPGCSARLTIAGGASPRYRDEPEPEPEEHRPKRLRSDDEEPTSQGGRPPGNWKPIAKALRGEQTCVVIAIFQFVLLILFVLAAVTTRDEGITAVLGVVFVAVPAIVNLIMAISARQLAMRAPVESNAKGTALASFLSSLTMLVCFGAIVMVILLGVGQQIDSRDADLYVGFCLGGFVLSFLLACTSFMGFAAQVGLSFQSFEVSKKISQLMMAGVFTLLTLMMICFLYSMYAWYVGPMTMQRAGFGGGITYYTQRDDSPFLGVLLGFFLPVSIIVLLIMYSRVLGAARRVCRGE